MRVSDGSAASTFAFAVTRPWIACASTAGASAISHAMPSSAGHHHDPPRQRRTLEPLAERLGTRRVDELPQGAAERSDRLRLRQRDRAGQHGLAERRLDLVDGVDQELACRSVIRARHSDSSTSG